MLGCVGVVRLGFWGVKAGVDRMNVLLKRQITNEVAAKLEEANRLQRRAILQELLLRNPDEQDLADAIWDFRNGRTTEVQSILKLKVA